MWWHLRCAIKANAKRGQQFQNDWRRVAFHCIEGTHSGQSHDPVLMFSQYVVDIAHIECFFIFALEDGFTNDVVEGWILVKELLQNSFHVSN